MINLDLKFIENKGLNINEYLTLIKIKEIEDNSLSIPFNTNGDILTDLQDKGFIIFDDIISLTPKGKEIFQIDAITEVINYFKQVTNKKILETSPSNRKFIKDRLGEGYTIEDLKAVIDKKNKEWAGTSMDMYIRIQTLFNDTKFQKYISEISTSDKKESVAVNIRRI